MNNPSEHKEVQKPTKLYSSRAVFVGGLLGGPLAGVYMFKENATTLGKVELSKKVFTNGILLSILYFFIVYFIPESVPIPNIAYSAFVAALIQQLMNKEMGTELAEKIEQPEYVKQTKWQIVWVSLVGTIVSLAALIPIGIIISLFSVLILNQPPF